MKKVLMGVVILLFLTGVSYAQDVGLSFFTQSNGNAVVISFGVTFDMIKINNTISLGADWSVFNSDGQKRNLIGWCFRFTFKKLTIPIGYDFSNQRVYIGLGAKF